MTQRRGDYRKNVVNVMISIIISLVLNFSYVVFMVVNPAHREPAPEHPAKPRVEQVVESKVSTRMDGDMEIVAEADSLRREVIIREENISQRSYTRNNNSTSPLVGGKGQMFMLLDIIFYCVVAMAVLTVMTDTSRRRGHSFIRRLIMCLVLVLVAYVLSPQMTWRGDIIITANARHLFNPMTVLKLSVTLLVGGFYGKVYELLYAKQEVEMENERLQNENLSWQYNTLVNQVNPHFLFNSLNSLSMLIREQKSDDALTYIGQMSDTYRYIMEEGRAEKTTVESELRFVDAYRYLLEIRYAGKLTIRVDVERGMFECQLPPLSIQPLIENAVKHNSITSSRPLTITISSEGEYIVVSNTKNPKLQPEESTGIGLANLSSRYELIVGRKVEVVDEGGIFTVKLPVIR